MPKISFDFQRYVALRKGQRQAERREGAAYAFSADLRLLRKIERLGPVPTVLEEAGRLFQKQAQSSLLSPALLATPKTYPAVYHAAKQCAERLHLLVPSVYVSSELPEAYPITLGTGSEAYVLLPKVLVDQLSEEELLFVVGAECGRIQNGHLSLRTALFYVTHIPSGFMKFAVIPAKSILSVWLRRANITADRAGLLCSRQVEVSMSALKKMLATYDAVEKTRRVQALLRFAESRYFRKILNLEGGETQEACDEAVAVMMDEKPNVGEE